MGEADTRPSSLQPVILAGGSGTRLWPLSRELYPKQFLKLIGDRTMLQHTLARLDGLPHEAPVIVCNEEHRFVVAEQCRLEGITPGAIVLEPARRNTAPAVALAALRAMRDGADPLLLVLAADSHVDDGDEFRGAIRRAMPFAEQGKLMVFGASPTHAEPGYGYIRRGAASADPCITEVAAFTEKPSKALAERYLAEGGYAWNCGMFLFRASTFLDELRTFRPDILAACTAAASDETLDLGFARPGKAFLDCPADSVDYAVMERTRRAMVVATDMGWADIGSWDALAATVPHDDAGNATRGDVIALDTRDSVLQSSDRLVAALGLEDVVAVETSDAVLVADRKRAQDVKALVEAMDSGARAEHRLHTTAYRPWGHAETIKGGPGFPVKRIAVSPGESLSLQLHRHRAEHWVVVRGQAEVTRGRRAVHLAPGRVDLHSGRNPASPRQRGNGAARGHRCAGRRDAVRVRHRPLRRPLRPSISRPDRRGRSHVIGCAAFLEPSKPGFEMAAPRDVGTLDLSRRRVA